MTWRDGAAEIDSQRYSPSLALLVDIALDRAVETHASRISECLLLDALLAPVDDAALLSIPAEDQRHFRDAAAMATNHLAAGVTVRNCLDAFAVVTQTTATEINPFDREAWDEPWAASWMTCPTGRVSPIYCRDFLPS